MRVTGFGTQLTPTHGCGPTTYIVAILLPSLLSSSLSSLQRRYNLEMYNNRRLPSVQFHSLRPKRHRKWLQSNNVWDARQQDTSDNPLIYSLKASHNNSMPTWNTKSIWYIWLPFRQTSRFDFCCPSDIGTSIPIASSYPRSAKRSAHCKAILQQKPPIQQPCSIRLQSKPSLH